MFQLNLHAVNVLRLNSNLNCSQFVQHYGSVALPSNVEGGFYTDARGEVRRSADQKAQRQIQKLNASINITLNSISFSKVIFDINCLYC